MPLFAFPGKLLSPGFSATYSPITTQEITYVMAFYYNQSEAVPNIPGKQEHDYRRQFTDVSCPYFFLREVGTSVHRLPTSCNFKIRVSWLMLSKALLMSKNTAKVNIFWSIALGIGSVFVAVLGLC